jgi:hypothetical protein
MLHTLNINRPFDLDKCWEGVRVASLGTFFQPVPVQLVGCALPSSKPQYQRAHTTRRLPDGRTARSRHFVVCPGDARTGLSAGTAGRDHAAHRPDDIVAAGAVSLDYEITRGLERIAESLKLTGLAH